MVALNNAVDAAVAENNPNANYGLVQYLGITAAGTGQERQAYIYFGRPFPLGVTILSATLRVYSTSAAQWAGTNTINVQRVAANWSVNRITYNNKPGVLTGTASCILTNPAANAEWAFDVKSQMQAVSDGGTFQGFRLTGTGTGAKYIYSAQAVQPYRPTLEIVWSDAPNTPEVLRPDGNRTVSIAKPVLRFDFTDVSGSTAMAACQVQFNATNVWSGPSYDTGEILTSIPQLDTAAPLVSIRSVTTNSNTIVNGPTGTFHASDVGATIVRTGIPGGATITVFTSSTQVTISAAASNSTTADATITKTWPGLSDGVSTFWRVRVKDAVGLWSAWSNGAQFQRLIHGTLTLNNPAVSPNNFIYESTPPIDWSFTVRVQKHYQVIIALASNTAKWLWDSGKVTSTATLITLPAGKLTKDDAVYNVRIRVWDTVSREATPTDTAYVEVSRDFTFNGDAGVGGVTSLVATPQTPLPWMLLTWNRSSMPDRYDLIRDGKPFYNADAVTFFVSGTSYQAIDRLAEPRVAHTWRVYAVVNNKRDNTGTSVVGTTRADSTVLARTDGGEPILILNATTTPELRTISEVHEVLAPVAPVLITQSLRGYEGTVSGVIADDTLSGRTARQMRDTLKSWRGQQGTKRLLYLVDEAFEVVIFNLKYKARAYSGNKVKYEVSFDFIQTDF
jgi:hypothetical protein